MSELRLRDAEGPADMDTVRTMFREYATWLGVDLCFQAFDEELATLPGFYSPPAGGLLLAEVGDAVAGVVGLRAVDPGTAEMKRLWVRSGFRGLGLGRRLAVASVDLARKRHYGRVVLDTLSDPRLDAARGIYEAMGFRPIQPYYHNPLDGVLYYGLDL